MEKPENDLQKEMLELQSKLKELKNALSKQNGFKHTCPHCGAEWVGRKEKIKECLYCHFRMEIIETPLKDVETRKKACESLDKTLKEKGRIIVDGSHVFN